MEENVNDCILSAQILIPRTRMTVYAECIYAFLSKY